MTKIKALLIVFICVLSCKNTTNKTKMKPLFNKQNNVLLTGDSLISNKNFINKIDSSCIKTTGYYGRTEEEANDYKNKCVYYRIDFSYEELNSIDDEFIQRVGDVDCIIRNSNDISDSDDFIIKNLILKKNNIETDSIRIYSYENYIEALAQKNDYYYLKNNRLWILKFNEDEDGIRIVDWKQYFINYEGKIILLKGE